MISADDKPFNESQTETVFKEKRVYQQKARRLVELDNYQLTQEIKERANDICFNKMGAPIKREGSRKSLLYYCVLSAHLELDILVDPYKLGEMFGLDRAGVLECNSIFSPLEVNGYQPPRPKYPIINFLPTFCEKLGLIGDHFNTIKALAIKVMDLKDREFDSAGPHPMAAAVFYYYIQSIGLQLDNPKEIKKITGRSLQNIKDLANKIALYELQS